MAKIPHEDIDLAYMHAPAAISFAVNPAAFQPPRSGFLYLHSPSGTLWKSNSTTIGDLEFTGFLKDFKLVEKTSTYQLDADVFDLKRNVLLFVNAASSANVVVPLDATYNFPVGFALPVHQTGVGLVAIAAASGVTIATPAGLEIGSQYNFCTLLKVGANSWRFLPNGVGGGDFDSILTDPSTGSVLVDPATGNVLTTPTP